MSNQHINLDDCVRLLRQIVAIWPHGNDEQVQGCQAKLGAYLDEDFDPVDLQNRIDSIASIERVERTSSGAEIQFHDADGCLQRGSFVLYQGTTWHLRSMKFQCPVCFGDGVNDDRTCSMCGGTGWGASPNYGAS
jgi:DnaJ-class molecular chaperone